MKIKHMISLAATHIFKPCTDTSFGIRPRAKASAESHDNASHNHALILPLPFNGPPGASGVAVSFLLSQALLASVSTCSYRQYLRIHAVRCERVGGGEKWHMTIASRALGYVKHVTSRPLAFVFAVSHCTRSKTHSNLRDPSVWSAIFVKLPESTGTSGGTYVKQLDA